MPKQIKSENVISRGHLKTPTSLKQVILFFYSIFIIQSV